jgi:phosphotransferase system enzyme I (PtsP)
MERKVQRGAAWSDARRVLKSVRDVMAAARSAEARLERMVQVIAAGMVAEVCSIYVLRAGDVLELFATEGLKHEAVHVTRLRVGEGVVGQIAAHARPVALADAKSHPAFAYRPETGEEIYRSLLGVPILRGGRVVGVLVVQNRKPRHYTDEESEALETIAMVLAELVAGGELVDPAELHPTDGIALLPLRLEGARLNGGIGMGLAVLHRPRVAITRIVAEDPAAERERFDQAVSSLHTALDDLFAAADLGDSGEHRDVLEAYRMFAEDRGWLMRIREAIGNGLTAEAAVQKVQDDTRLRMSHITDPYLRERMHDFEDLTNRLMQHLAGNGQAALAALPDDVVLIARSLGPAELLDYDRARLRAVVLEEGSATAHVAIIGRALGVPVLGRVKGVVEKIDPLDPVIVDADHGQMFIRPGEDVQQAFQEAMQARAIRAAAYVSMRDLPAVTSDGVSVTVNINAGLLADLSQLDETGADGVGLYRTEIPFMVRSNFPDVNVQTRFYRKVFKFARNRPVAFRTLDIGGDKLLSYMPPAGEENPAMGWRSIRIGLDHPVLLREQLRALIRAAAKRRLEVMFPMISEVAEFDAARAILDIEVERARSRGGQLPKEIRVGAMLEVPALAWQIEPLLARVDFLSIGSNDLLQFLFASDRGHPALSERYDMLSPAVLMFLRSVVERCAEAKVPLGICGEMAGRPLEAMALVGVGLRSLSMAPASVGPVKAMVRSLDLASLEPYVLGLCRRPDRSLRAALKGFAQDHGVSL